MGTRGCGARRTTSAACATLGRAAGRQKASAWAVGRRRRVGRCLGGEGDRSNRGGDDAGAHARRMRRRTPGLTQVLTFPLFNSIYLLSSSSLPSLAAYHKRLLYLLSLSGLRHGSADSSHGIGFQAFASSATCGFGGGGTRGSAVMLERRRRALRRGAHMQLAQTPLGARVAAAAVARGRVEDARSDHGALPQRLAPEAPSSVVWACEAAVAPKAPNVCDAGHRARRGHRARE